MIACVDIICSILLAFVRTREVGVSSRNVVSRTSPHFSHSMMVSSDRRRSVVVGFTLANVQAMSFCSS